jgi:excinuclease ABC subunit B
VRYLHSDIDTVERVEIIRDLRLGEFDVLVGINLLREGLDIPEVSLVAILDADKEGFLRRERSLIQTIGRARAHQRHGDPLRRPDDRLDDGGDRRDRAPPQQAARVEREMGITPIGVQKRIKDIIEGVYDPDEAKKEQRAAQARAKYEAMPEKDLERELKQLEKQMMDAARNLEFERAAELRDRLHELKQQLFWRRPAGRALAGIESRAWSSAFLSPPLRRIAIAPITRCWCSRRRFARRLSGGCVRGAVGSGFAPTG